MWCLIITTRTKIRLCRYGRRGSTSRTTHSGEGFNVFGVVEKRVEGEITRLLVLIMKMTCVPNFRKLRYYHRTMGSLNRASDGFLAAWTVRVRYKVDHFKFAWPRPCFCDPKTWELVKHKNDRHVSGKVKSPLLALSEESGREINQPCCTTVSGRPPLDLGVRQDTSRPGSAGHDA
jgi:hypothetical protein